MMKTYHVSFERIGRNHSVAPMIAKVEDADQLADYIHRHARPHLRSRDAAAMKRRDDAAATGAHICPVCAGSGVVDDDGARICPACAGETWIDKDGKPLKIDPDNVRLTWTRERG